MSIKIVEKNKTCQNVWESINDYLLKINVNKLNYKGMY